MEQIKQTEQNNRRQVYTPRPRSAVNVTLPSIAAERRRLLHGARSAPAAVDRYLLPAARSAANPLHAAAAVDRWALARPPSKLGSQENSWLRR